ERVFGDDDDRNRFRRRNGFGHRGRRHDRDGFRHIPLNRRPARLALDRPVRPGGGHADVFPAPRAGFQDALGHGGGPGRRIGHAHSSLKNSGKWAGVAGVCHAGGADRGGRDRTGGDRGGVPGGGGGRGGGGLGEGRRRAPRGRAVRRTAAR